MGQLTYLIFIKYITNKLLRYSQRMCLNLKWIVSNNPILIWSCVTFGITKNTTRSASNELKYNEKQWTPNNVICCISHMNKNFSLKSCTNFFYEYILHCLMILELSLHIESFQFDPYKFHWNIFVYNQVTTRIWPISYVCVFIKATFGE